MGWDVIVRLFGRMYEVTASTAAGRREGNQDFHGWTAVTSGTLIGSTADGVVGPVPDTRDDFLLAVVCDGMGGLKDGADASRTVVEGLMEWAAASPHADTGDAPSSLMETITGLEGKVMEEHPGSGTTLSAIIASNRRWISVHLGDSRCYAFSGDYVWRTKDHSPAEAMFQNGLISEDEMSEGPMGGMISAFIGDRHSPKTVVEDIPRGWDRLLLCSDGAFGCMTTDDFIDLASSADAAGIVEGSYGAGSRDNITALLIEDAGRVGLMGMMGRAGRRRTRHAGSRQSY